MPQYIISQTKLSWYTLPMQQRFALGIILAALALVGFRAIAAPVQTWSLTAVGDIMLDRYVWSKIQTKGTAYPFDKIQTQFKGADVVLANLEGPFTSSKKHAVAGGSLSFNFDPVMIPILKKVGLTTLLLGNNHTLNQGQAGLDNTKVLLKKNGLEYFGDPKNRAGTTVTKTINGEKVCFIGYDSLDGTITQVLNDVKAAHKRKEYVIVAPHWGAEYQLGIQKSLQTQAHQLIDAGADMILGGHPHVVEPFELYKGKFIAYSLGNFIFDQYFSADTQQELMLKLRFSPSSITVSIIPMTSVSSQPIVATGTVKQKLLDRLAANSVVSKDLRDGIRRGSITFSRP